MNRTRSLIAGAVAAGLVTLGSPLPAAAAMVGTQAALSPSQRAADIASARAFLDRQDVRRDLVKFGVTPAEAKARVASLTDSELQQMQRTIGSAPAAGDGVLVLLGAVFLVLIVLDLIGVIHIFS
jgi:hypothetical protein